MTRFALAAFAMTLMHASSLVAQAPAKKPNILVIMGDDIGWFNPSIYHRGIMGYQTPNIDRIGKEGAMFVFAHEDLLPTFAAAAGDTDVVARCAKGCQAGSRSFKVHLDGYNLIPFFKGEAPASFSRDRVMEQLSQPKQ